MAADITDDAAAVVATSTTAAADIPPATTTRRPSAQSATTTTPTSRPATTARRRKRRRPLRCPPAASASASATAATAPAAAACAAPSSSAEPQPQLHPPKAQPLPSKHKRRAAIASHRRRRWTRAPPPRTVSPCCPPSTYPVAHMTTTAPPTRPPPPTKPCRPAFAHHPEPDRPATTHQPQRQRQQQQNHKTISFHWAATPGRQLRRRRLLFTHSTIWLLMLTLLWTTTTTHTQHAGVLTGGPGSALSIADHVRPDGLPDGIPFRDDDNNDEDDDYNTIDEYNTIDDWSYPDDDDGRHFIEPPDKRRQRPPRPHPHRRHHSTPASTTAAAPQPQPPPLDGVIMASLGCPNCIYNIQFAAAVAAQQRQQQQHHHYQPPADARQSPSQQHQPQPQPHRSPVEPDGPTPADVTEMRLEAIKYQILSKLGMSMKPNISRDLPKRVVFDTLSRAEQSSSIVRQMVLDEEGHAQLHHYSERPYPQLRYAMTSEPATGNRTRGDGDNANASAADRGGARGPYDTYYTYSSDADRPGTGGGGGGGGTVHKRRDHSDEAGRRPHRNNDDDDARWRPFDGPDEADHGGAEPDDFFGQTKEIITFADKGHLLNGHRLVEFATAADQRPPTHQHRSGGPPFAGGVYTSDLHVRNAYVWVKMSLRPGHASAFTASSYRGTSNQLHPGSGKQTPSGKHSGPSKHGRGHRPKGPKFGPAPGSAITVWVFRVIEPPPMDESDDENADDDPTMDTSADMQMHLLGDKEFDARTEIAGSKVVQLSNVGWQRIDISATVRKWYAQTAQTSAFTHHRHRLRLLIDCSGCGDRVTLHLFNASPTARKQHPHHHQSYHPNHLHPAAPPAAPPPPPDDTDESSDASRPFLVVFTDPAGSNNARRVRRRAVDCAGAAPRQCCKEKFYVDFRELGWDDWIIAPHGYYANYCRGDCSGPRSPDQFQSYHSHVLEEYRKMDRLSGLQPCCAPVKFSSMSLIYFEEDQKIVKRDLPKMVVDECGCP